MFSFNIYNDKNVRYIKKNVYVCVLKNLILKFTFKLYVLKLYFQSNTDKLNIFLFGYLTI